MSSSPFSTRAISRSKELSRILDIPRRTWTPEDAQALADRLTALLKTPHGTMSLRPTQAVALAEIGTQKGGFFPIRVGGGKTLISLLAPYVLGARRPILLAPAALITKTESERGQLMAHWEIPLNLRAISYELLGRDQAKTTLTDHRPDVIIADEAHRLKNKRAGVTRRLTRYLAEHPDTIFIALSGTMIKNGLADFGRLLRWALKDRAPIPRDDHELEDWATCLAEDVPLRPVRPGALLELCNTEELREEELTAARVGFQRRLLETAGVVATPGESVACSLYVSDLPYRVNPVTESNFQTLRSLWQTPDEWSLSQAVDVWRHARELALGFHYVWDPRPPKEWLEARKNWAKYVRDILSHSRTLDTELQVSKAVSAGILSDGLAFFQEWEKVKPSFSANQRAIWHDDHALNVAAGWMEEGSGIVWVEHRQFGAKLSALTGAPYFGQGAVSPQGEHIRDERGNRPVIASIRGCGTGQNLQMFARNLVTSVPNGADVWEQMLGRTHRDGQKADEVRCQFLAGCAEHIEGLGRALTKARMAAETLGQPQKLLLADVTAPGPEVLGSGNYQGARWTRTPITSGSDTNDLLARILESEGLL